MITSFSLISVNNDFFTLYIVHNSRRYIRTLYCRMANLHLVTAHNKYLVKYNGLSGFCAKFFNIDHIAFGYFVRMRAGRAQGCEPKPKRSAAI